jgi:NACHT domain
VRWDDLYATDQVNFHSDIQDLHLSKLPRAATAGWECIDSEECLQGTRTSVLEGIEAWIHTNGGPQVYWLNGLAGTGKSTLAKSVARLAADQGLLGASFFCSRDEADRSDGGLIIPTLAIQLSDTDPRFREELVAEIKGRRNIGYALPSEQLQKLVINPLKKTRLPTQRIVIIMDALDECKDDQKIYKILEALSLHISSVPALKVLVTSRPEPATRLAFRDPLSRHSDIFFLHDVRQNVVDKDIRVFFTIRLQEMAKRRRLEDLAEDWIPSEDWPPAELIRQLVSKASGLFIFASTVCKFVDLPGDIEDRLKEIAELPTNENEGRLGIDQLYRKIVESAITPFFRNSDIQKCRSILGTIILLMNPLSLNDLSRLLGHKPTSVAGLLRNFHSVLAMPRNNDKAGVLRIIHTSFRDFLTSPARCDNPKMCVLPATQHAAIAMSLFRRMEEGLKKNICNIDRFKFNREVEGLAERRAEFIDGSLAYACRYWADHLASASKGDSDVFPLIEALDDFMRMRFLYWVETLSLLGSMSIAVDALDNASYWHSVRTI